MTLRLRLVAALVALVTVGLAIFGFTTYGFYARSQYERLDAELRDLAEPVSTRLVTDAQLTARFGEPIHTQDSRTAGPGPSSYAAELRETATGRVIGVPIEPYDTLRRPDLPDVLGFDGSTRWMDVDSVGGGSPEWRVLVSPVGMDRGPGIAGPVDPIFVVVAVPTSGVRASLQRLAAIELMAAFGLLVLVATGAWLVLRQGLRPLERMAATAGTITAGQLDTRVEPAEERSEVGQLGLALNTMLSRLERAFAEREATEQRLRQFLADASHELRTPLTSIQGYAELFRLGAEVDQGDLALTLRRIEEESARMHHLVDDLLLLARLDQTRPLERAPVDLAVVAADACSAAVAVEPDRPVTLHAPAPVVVQGDDDHLRQAVDNLVTNALRHTPAGSSIEVGVGIEGREAVVTVRDHGPGLDGEAIAHAFDRFWQRDPSRSDAGAGLGLSIVAAIAAEHHGVATVANVGGAAGAGQGAVFSLRLPLD